MTRNISAMFFIVCSIALLFFLTPITSASTIADQVTVIPSASNAYDIYATFNLSADQQQSNRLTITHTTPSGTYPPDVITLKYCIVDIRNYHTNELIPHKQQDKQIPIYEYGGLQQLVIETLSQFGTDIISVSISIAYQQITPRTELYNLDLVTLVSFSNTPIEFKHQLTLYPYTFAQVYDSSCPRVRLDAEQYLFTQPQQLLTHLTLPPKDLDWGFLKITHYGRYEYHQQDQYNGEINHNIKWDNDPKCTVNGSEINVEIRPIDDKHQFSYLLIPISPDTRTNIFQDGILTIMCNRDLSLEPIAMDLVDLNQFNKNFGDVVFTTIELLNTKQSSINYLVNLRTTTTFDYHQPVTIPFGFADATSVLCQITIGYDGYDHFTNLDTMSFLFPYLGNYKGSSQPILSVEIHDASDQILGRTKVLIDYIEDKNGYTGYLIKPVPITFVNQETLNDQTLLNFVFSLDYSQWQLKTGQDVQCGMIFQHSNAQVRPQPEHVTGSSSDLIGYFTTGPVLKM